MQKLTPRTSATTVSFDGETTSYEIRGLKTDTWYIAHIRAGNEAGFGPWSQPQSWRTKNVTVSVRAVTGSVTEGQRVLFAIDVDPDPTSSIELDLAYRWDGGVWR